MSFEDHSLLASFGVGHNGFGQSSIQELNELHKALGIGTTDPGVTRGDGDPFRTESLDATLHLATFKAENARLWRAISKTRAYSTVEEYNRLHSYGDQSVSGFISQDDTTYTEQDSVQSRQYETVKYIGVQRSINHAAVLAGTQPSNLMSLAIMNGVNFMIQKINEALYYGDASVDSLQWNGLAKQISSEPTSVIDMRGGELSAHVMDEAAYRIAERFGMPQCIFTNSRIFSDFSRSYAARQRFNIPPSPTPGIAGTPLMAYHTPHGILNFESDVFVKPGRAVPRTGGVATSPGAPAAPGTVTAAVATAGSGETSQHSGMAVLFSYRVTAVNRTGESIPSAAVDAAATDTGEKVTLTIPATTGAYSYRVYRDEGGTARQTGDLWYIGQVSPATVGASATFVDLNATLPRTYIALVLDMTPESLTFRQFAPLMRLPFARRSTRIEWLQLLYGTPIVFAPERNVVIKNLGYDKSITSNVNAAEITSLTFNG